MVRFDEARDRDLDEGVDKEDRLPDILHLVATMLLLPASIEIVLPIFGFVFLSFGAANMPYN